MISIWKWIAPALLFVACTAAPRDAEAATLTCDSCTATQAKSMAERHLFFGYGLYTRPRPILYVLDTTAGKAFKYRYRYSTETVPYSDEVLVTQWVDVLTSEPQLVSTMQQIKADRPRNRIEDTNKPGLPGSAYQTISNPALQTAVSNDIRSRAVNLSHSILALVALGLNGLDATGLNIVVVWVYPDGTQDSYRYNPSQDRYDRIPHEGLDGNSNIIPETRLDYSGGAESVRDYTFNPGTENQLEQFLTRARALGISVFDNRPGARGPAGTSCVTHDGLTVCVVTSQ